MGLHKFPTSTSPPTSTIEGQGPTIKPEEDEFERLVSEVKDWQITHGILFKLVKTETPSTVHSRPVGATLVPTPLPRADFEEAIAIQSTVNALYIRAASDLGWLSDVLNPLIKHDHLCRALWDILLETRKAGPVQDVVCGIFRSDYMFQSSGIKQVEMNTFSIAGACHAQRVAEMHHHLNRTSKLKLNGIADHSDTLPTNTNISSIVGVLAEAHRLYEATSSYPPCVLMIVQPFNFNIADERPIEYGLWDCGVPCYRCEWACVMNRTRLAPDRTLFFEEGFHLHEVSVIYYRAGYDAAEYSHVGKQVRLRLEISRAIKCPDIAIHLTTLKAVQEALTRPGAVERFLPTQQAARIRQTFMPMQALDLSDKGRVARQRALNPVTAKDYVLKPNLEGGGHNVYRDDIAGFLSTLPEEKWQNYILMRCIEPVEQEGHLLLAEELYQGPVIAELGAIGNCIWRREGSSATIVANRLAGWTLKVKPTAVNEMSVAKGYGSFSTPCLLERDGV